MRPSCEEIPTCPRGGIISLFYMIHGLYRFLDSQECLFLDEHSLHVVSLSNHRHVSMCYKSDPTRCFTQSFRSLLNAGDTGVDINLGTLRTLQVGM